MAIETPTDYATEIRELIGDENVRQVVATGSRVICPAGIIT